MTKDTWGKCAAVGILTLGISAALPGQPPAPDPWRRVPSLPTSCFYDGDFLTRLRTVMEETNADIHKQEELNAKAKERFDAMDGMEKARRMQAYMSNPQNARKMLEASQAATASFTDALDQATKSTAKLDKELANHKSAFEAAADNATKPVLARQEALIKAKTRPVGETRSPAFAVAADHTQYVALVQEQNAEYEKACVPYFGPKGAFRAWLDTYRTDVTEKMIAVGEGNEAAMSDQMAMMDMSAGGYRSTAKLAGVRSYLDQLYKVASYRRQKAAANIELAR